MNQDEVVEQEIATPLKLDNINGWIESLSTPAQGVEVKLAEGE